MQNLIDHRNLSDPRNAIDPRNVINLKWDSIADDNATTKQAAEWMRRSVDTMKRWRRMRIGPPHFKINGRTYYSKQQLQAWIESQRELSQGNAA